MARVARPVDRTKILNLKAQIDDDAYIQAAIDRLAGRITERLLGFDDDAANVHDSDYRSASNSSNPRARFLDREE